MQPGPVVHPVAMHHGATTRFAGTGLIVDDVEQGQTGLQEVLIAPPLRIRHLPGRGSRLVLSLAGVGTEPGKEPPPEFFRMASADGENHVLFVSDQSRSWLNAPGMAETIVARVESIRNALGITEIVALGNSMGGTMALHLARLIPMTRTLALVPQYSADPALVPDEHRWLPFRRRIAAFPFRAVDSIAPQGTHIVLHGGTTGELRHALAFPQADNLRHYILPHHNHNLARRLHDRGRLAPLVSAFLEGRLQAVDRKVRALGGVARQDHVLTAAVGEPE